MTQTRLTAEECGGSGKQQKQPDWHRPGRQYQPSRGCQLPQGASSRGLPSRGNGNPVEVEKALKGWEMLSRLSPAWSQFEFLNEKPLSS